MGLLRSHVVLSVLVLVAAAVLWRWPSAAFWGPFLLVNLAHPSLTETWLDAVWRLQDRLMEPEEELAPMPVATFAAADFLTVDNDGGAFFNWSAVIAEVLRRDEPVLVKGVLQAVASGALAWDLDGLSARLAHRNVTVRTKNRGAMPGSPAWKFEQVPFADAIRRVATGESQMYDLETLVEEETLQAELQLPAEFTSEAGVFVAAADGWKTEMHAHSDLTTNLILHGRKRWHLVHRRDSLRLRPFFTAPKLQGISAQVQPWASARHPDADSHLARIPRWDVTTEVGDAFLFPPWTFHALTNLPSANESSSPAVTAEAGKAAAAAAAAADGRLLHQYNNVNLALLVSNVGSYSATLHPLWMAVMTMNHLRMLGPSGLLKAWQVYSDEDMDENVKRVELRRIISSPFSAIEL